METQVRIYEKRFWFSRADWRWGLALTIGLLFSWLGVNSIAAAPPPPRIAPDLARVLAAGETDPQRIIVILHPPEGPLRAAPNTPVTRAALVQNLQRDYADAKTSVSALLIAAQARGDVSAIRDLWIIRGVALTARPAFIQELMISSAVAEIRSDKYQQYLAPDALNRPDIATVETLTWGVEKIRAPEVWHTLGISGTGAVVAVMDTGVEYLHPALTASYYGNMGHGIYNHNLGCFDAINDSVYPYDDQGHGTHVAGTIVGATGTGVAPGARWMAVKVLSGEGFGYDSWIHAGFQWILAPNGDPALAPDAINASWSSTVTGNEEFAPDIQALLTANIIPLFAAGNAGPESSSVGSPASLPGVFGIGASDLDDDIPMFSSRGPSPWGEIKPYVVAPGVHILSSVPGGAYREYNGTSMATPHIVGVAALMRSVSPTLSVAEFTRILTTTAVPLTTTIPNNDSGWGRVDAFRALVALTHPGIITGTISRAGDGQPLHAATIQAVPRGSTQIINGTTHSNGTYHLALPAQTYDLHVARFGYIPQTLSHVQVENDTPQVYDFRLLALPTRSLYGTVTDAHTAAPPTRTITLQVLHTPISTTLEANGRYQLQLPAGTYTLKISGFGYRVLTTTVTLTADSAVQRSFTLTPAPTILVVDEGAWHYQSESVYLETALDALAYTYHTTHIKCLPTDIPSITTLQAYDIVLWSAPSSSPGIVGGSTVLQTYLHNGGRLLLSGQNIAYYDAGGSWSYPRRAYLTDDISVAYSEDAATTRTLSGAGPFAGMTITITGKSGANNQASPDVVQVRDMNRAEPLWRYSPFSTGGIGASLCVPYRALFFSFGYEAIAGAEQRNAVLARSLAWLAAPPLTHGLRVEQLTPVTQVGLPGQTITHTFQLHHIASAGVAAEVTLAAEGQQWPTVIRPTRHTLQPCSQMTITVEVTIPPDVSIEADDTLTLNIQSPQIAQPLTVLARTKTPAPVLLVDDDRWYPMEDYYTSALAAQHIPFDVWDTQHHIGGKLGAFSPLTATLLRYPLIVWFTGYDWLEPILALEESRMLAFLEQGGRLLFSSQDFLYYHTPGDLAQQMGVYTWNAMQAPLTAAGVPDHLAGGQWGPVALTYPFQNWSDVVEPLPDARPIVRGDLGQPLALAARPHVSATAKTIFYGFPLETLPDQARATALGSALDWLAPLGDSTWTLTPTTPTARNYVVSKIVLRNDYTMPLSVTLSQLLPTALNMITDTHAISTSFVLVPPSPALEYAPDSRALSWAGWVTPGTPLTLTWSMAVAGISETTIVPTLTLGLPAWKLNFVRQATLNIGGGSLSASAWLSPANTPLLVGQPVTLGLRLHNDGVGAINNGRVSVWMMQGFASITATLPPTRGMALAVWEGSLAPGATHTVRVSLRAWYARVPLRVDALLEDRATGERWEKRLWLSVTDWLVYLPVILQMK